MLRTEPKPTQKLSFAAEPLNDRKTSSGSRKPSEANDRKEARRRSSVFARKLSIYFPSRKVSKAPSANDEVWRGFEHRLTRAITAVLDFAVPSRRRRQQISKELKGQESGN
ncbi:hypothetical protein AAVH_07488 [Aphelenchoides avenae]|nr:hypothetical protein AAVH_07488 [Aphelenchus avenae]